MFNKIFYKFLFVFLVLTSTISYFLIVDYNKSINTYLEEQTNNNYLKFKAIYNKHKEISNIIFDADINIEEILSIFKDAHKSSPSQKDIIREKLLQKLSSQYKKLKSYNLKQLHFHLPNNDSFLRMHRPKKYGDNLTDIRSTVAYVNKNKEYIHGFEEGRIFNGFRYVYPLFWEEEHIGSVEISFSALALIQSFRDTFDMNSNFLIRKDVVDKKVFEDEKKNYILSPQKEFYFEKSVYEMFPPVSITTKAKDTTQKTLEGKPYSFYIESLNFLKTIIPIHNPISNEVVAAICVCEKNTYMKNAKRILIIMLLSTFISISLILYLFFRQLVANEKLKVLNKNLDRKIQLEIKKSKQKDIYIQNQSKLASIGEMLNNIAHQWRQPLNVISTSSSSLKINKELGTLDDESFDKLTDVINDQTQFLSKTIESFKEYLNINKNEKEEKSSIQKTIENVLKILNSSFEYNQIKLNKEIEEKEIFIKASENQLLQVLISVFNNAKEVLIKNNDFENREINIKIKTKGDYVQIIIKDNGGGVPENIIDKIFEPYFTTKHQSQGTGISLFMSYEVIANDLHGKLYVKNTKDSASFFIEIPYIK